MIDIIQSIGIWLWQHPVILALLYIFGVGPSAFFVVLSTNNEYIGGVEIIFIAFLWPITVPIYLVILLVRLGVQIWKGR